MKILIFLFLQVLFVFNAVADNPLTARERKAIVKHLKASMRSLEKTVEGMTDDQADYKVSPDSWSVKECIYHLALAEDNYWKWLNESLESPANPEKRSSSIVTDEQVLAMISSRDKKVKTVESFMPSKGKWSGFHDGLGHLKNRREEHIDYLTTTTASMRDHIVESKIGLIDAYQIVLWASAHTERHRKQIEEIKASPGFPKK